MKTHASMFAGMLALCFLAGMPAATGAAGTPTIIITDSVAPAVDWEADLGQVAVGTDATVTVTMSNLGSGDLIIQPLVQLDPPFALVNDHCSGATVAPSQNCTVQVTFSPLAAGDFDDDFDIFSNDPDPDNAQAFFFVFGAGILAPNVVVTDSALPADDHDVAFGSVTMGDTNTQTVTVANTGSMNLVLGTVVQPAAPFSLVNDTCSGQTLTPTASCTADVNFSPVAEGSFSGSVDILSDDPDQATVSVTLSGTGTQVPVADIAVTDSVSPPGDHAVAFGNTANGMTSTKTVTVKNDGAADLNIGTVASVNSLGTPFSISSENCSSQTLAPNEDCTITVAFSPDDVKSFTDSFDIPSDDPDNSSVTVSVTGNGQNAAGGGGGGGGGALDPLTLVALSLLGFAISRRARR